MIERILEILRRLFAPQVTPPHEPKLAWGAKVSSIFRDRVRWIESELGVDANHLMAVMAFESAYTFRADITNFAGSGATGLIQFMPRTAEGLGTTTERLARMTPEDQLNYVYKHFRPYAPRIRTLEDTYMAVLWPRAIGEPNDYVLWCRTERERTYLMNHGLDVNKDGKITKHEAAHHIRLALERGLLPENVS